jgi:uncharacterized protein YacL
MFCAVRRRRRRRTCALFTTKLARRVLGRAASRPQSSSDAIVDFSFLIDGRFESIDENPLSRAFAKRIFIDQLRRIRVIF